MTPTEAHMIAIEAALLFAVAFLVPTAIALHREANTWKQLYYELGKRYNEESDAHHKHQHWSSCQLDEWFYRYQELRNERESKS